MPFRIRYITNVSGDGGTGPQTMVRKLDVRNIFETKLNNDTHVCMLLILQGNL